MNLSAVILAAGKGVRMRSSLPKVAHRVAGKPMILHIVDAVQQAGIDDITVVVGHGKETIQQILSSRPVNFALQEEQLGTGHALMQAKNKINPDHDLIVLTGDTPLLTSETIKKLTEHHRETGAIATVLSTYLSNPAGYGRIIRDADTRFIKIIEEKDAGPDEQTIGEVNSGMYCFQAGMAFGMLEKINTANAQGEYYLTDILELINHNYGKVEIVKIDDSQEILGINDRIQLAYAESLLRKRKNTELMQAGVTIVDPTATYIDTEVSVEQDTVIMPGTFLEGKTFIGRECHIGPFTRIIDSVVGNNVNIDSSKLIEARVADNCNIGPYAYLRPGANLCENAKVGDFVEIKKSLIGKHSKVPHLAYVGDATVGEKVNIGAGTITCNYDGKNKYETIIEDGAFIGSNTNLVAPVKIGHNATTGAGSTITHDVPADSLAVERARQKNIDGWARGREDK